MPVDEPSWWYADTNTILEHALAPAAWVYGRVARSRLRRPPTYRSRLPVICIGNFTAGGTGKTPLTRLITNWLAAAGDTPCVLTRGHGGALRGPHMVDGTADAAALVGDEALLLAQTCRVCLSQDRPAGARAIETLQQDDQVIVMDDGLQNPSLHRDFSIALVDATRGLGNGQVIPAGPLRAPIDDQLSRVDIIVLNYSVATKADNSSNAASEIRDWLQQRFSGPVLSARVVPEGDLDWLRGTPVVAYAGIANPDRFFDTIRSLGADLRATRSFRDHQMLTATDATELLDQAQRSGAQLVTTEKDHVRLPDDAPTAALTELRRQSRTLPIALQFDETEERALKTELRRAIDAVRNRQA